MSKPLEGKKILIPRLNEDKEESSSLIKDLGGIPIYVEIVKVVATKELQKLDEIVKNNLDYDWIVFTSKTGVRIFCDLIKKYKINISNIKFAAVGPSTAYEAKKHGINISFIPSKFTTKNLAEEIPHVENKKVLLIRSSNASDEAKEILYKRGALVEEIRPYSVENLELKNLNQDFDIVLLTSPSIVRAISNVESIREKLKDAIVCCIGPITAMEARKLNIKVDLIADEYTFKGLMNKLIEWMNNVKH